MSWLLPLIALTTAGLLLSRPLRKNRAWRATVTPLASIIGSGFLVVAPILGHLLGIYAFLGMLLITLLAIEIGEVIRFNIRHAEPLIGQGGLSPSAEWTERTANLALTLSYVVSVAFYLRLFSAFVLRAFGMEADFQADVLTTVILASIGIVGWRWGLHALENLEEYSVSIKLAVIAALLAGLGVHDVGTGFDLSGVGSAGHDLWEIVRVLGGLLLVVQGFETSRYLGNEYSADLRIRSMRRAQWLSTVIYLVFVLLVTPLLGLVESAHVDETAVIDLAAQAAWILGPMLVLAAVMSQFSAAVADTVGAGGIGGGGIRASYQEPDRLSGDRRAGHRAGVDGQSVRDHQPGIAGLCLLLPVADIARDAAEPSDRVPSRACLLPVAVRWGGAGSVVCRAAWEAGGLNTKNAPEGAL